MIFPCLRRRRLRLTMSKRQSRKVSPRCSAAGRRRFSASPPLLLSAAFLCLAFFLYSITSVHAQTVILHLRGGDRITGTITSENTNRLILSTKWSKELIVPRDEILKRELVPLAPHGKAGEAKPAVPTVALTNSAPQPGTALISGPLPPSQPKLPHHWA